LAAMLPAQEEPPKTYAGGQGFDPATYCQAHNLQVHHTKSWLDRSGAKCTVAVLEQCVFNLDHRLSAVIIGWPNGMRSYRCRHNSCLSKHWADAKAVIEPYNVNLDSNLGRLEENKQARIKQKFKPEEQEPELSLEEEQRPCDINELLDVFKKWLYIEEDYNIVAPMCAASANFCPGDPDIVGIIGPSGSTKTELIRSLGESQNEFVYPISSITEHTLVSGHKESKDIIPQLKGRLLTIKDFTSILAKDEKVRSQIFADFRDFTDGYLRKEWGNGIAKEYRDIHSSILFASTNAIERYYSMYANLGQRMIFLRPRNDSEKSRERAFQNRGKQKEMRQELHAIMWKFISSTKAKIDESGLPFTPEEVQTHMGKFYDFLAIARTPIHRDYRTDDIDEIPEPEFPTRICNTVSRLCEVHALFYARGEVGPEDVAFGKRIILDNIPTRRWQVLKAIDPGWLTTSIIAQKSDMSTGAAKRVLDELISLKLVERLAREEKSEGMDKRADSFKISDKWLGIVEELGGGIPGDSIADSERDTTIKKENIVDENSPPIFPIIIPGEDGDGKCGIGPHPRRDEPTPGKPPIVCVVCGADLAGKGQIERSGKFYCAKPGCGYPARGEAKT